MKKITVIILILVYGVSSSGMCISADYCCGKLSKLNIVLSQAENSKQNNQLENKKCCGHKEVNFKLKNDYQANVYQAVDFSLHAFVLPVFFNINDNLHSLNKTVTQHSNGPPLYSSSGLFIKHCSLRI